MIILEKIYNVGLILLTATLVYFSHLDRKEFIEELRDSRNSYIESLNSIETIKNDVGYIKDYIIGQKGVDNERYRETNSTN